KSNQADRPGEVRMAEDVMARPEGVAEAPRVVHPARSNAEPVLTVKDVDFWYGDRRALWGVDLDIYPGEVVAFMGPSGCGKTTLLKCFNRMQDDIPGARMTGEIRLKGEDIADPALDVPLLRRRFGWVAQAPNPFADTVYENVAYGPRLHGLVEDVGMDAHVRHCLEEAGLWEEVAERLDEQGTDLSGGQQQRLCIARALSVMPDVMLMDEPCSAIDPIATAHIERLIRRIAEARAVVIITHNMTQARRIADRVAFFKMGVLVEVGPTDTVFERPQHPETQAYLSGAFG
ncbi:MAG: phosphate ABC transporter ATP-binding protein, partial [Pseudomonadota bacterium]